MSSKLAKELDGKTIVIIGDPTQRNAVDIFESLRKSLTETNCQVIIVADINTLDHEKEDIVIVNPTDAPSMPDIAQDISMLDSMMMETENDRTGEFIFSMHHYLEDNTDLLKSLQTLPGRDLNDRFGSKKKGGRRNYGFVKQMGRKGSHK